jgi:SAM-dependent methyltransferase
MHDTARIIGKRFADTHAKKGNKILDVGGLNVNGSLRPFFESLGCEFVCLDMEEHESVDVVCKPQDPFPFEDGYFDIVISTSCFEHDPLFWLTFREMCRVVKLGGFIYINAPSAGQYHAHPGDCWRFYKDSGKALAFWSSYKINDTCYPATLVSQHFEGGSWKDNVCVWKRTDEPVTSFI